MKTVREQILEQLENMNNSDLVNTWNEYSRESSYDSEIYYNDDEFFEVYFSKPLEAVRAVCFGEYDYSDEYVKFNGYANLETTNDPSIWIDLEELAEYIEDNQRLFPDIEIEEEE